MSKFENVPVPSGNDVYWEPWVDAYDNEELTNAKMLFEQEFNRQMEMLDGDGAFEEEDGEDGESLEYGDAVSMFEKPIKTIITPFGVLPLTDTSLASSHFKFWVGHTNFKITNSLVDVIEKCDGVESLDTLTPYRFRIAIGKLFRDRDVMHRIKEELIRSI